MHPLLPLVLLDLGQTLNNLYNNLIRPLDIPITIIVIAIGGYYWMTGHLSDDVRRVSKGKAVIGGAIVGALIVWFAPDIGSSIAAALPK